MFDKSFFHDAMANDYVIPTVKFFSIVNYEYKLDPNYFPTLQNNSVKAFSYNIMEVIAEALLVGDPRHFVQSPDSRFTTGTNQRIFEDFGTSDICFKMFKHLKGETKNNKSVPLCIGVTKMKQL